MLKIMKQAKNITQLRKPGLALSKLRFYIARNMTCEWKYKGLRQNGNVELLIPLDKQESCLPIAS